MSFLIEKYTTSTLSSVTSGLMPFFPIIPVVLPLMINLWVKTDENSVKNQMWKTEYDFIIIGGGSAGSKIASLLAQEIDYKVLVLEAGGNENIFSKIPALSQTLQQTSFDWQYKTEPQDNSCLGLQNRQSVWPRGRVLGGTSVLSDMVYVNGNPNDYDEWARLGANGWSWKDVSPHFPVSESDGFSRTNNPEDIEYVAEEKIQKSLTIPSTFIPITRAFIRSGNKLNYSTVRFNTKSKIGFSVPQFTIEKGMKESSFVSFLEQFRKNENLDIVNYAFVKKIIIENNTAIGVEFDRFGSTYKIKAKRDVILSAGAIGSPQILMLSGIGPKQHLKALGIPVVRDLPVGHNLQDHYGSALSFTVKKNTAINIERDINIMQVLKYILFSEGVLSRSQIDSLAFINTKNSSDIPNVQLVLQPISFASDNGILFRKIRGIDDKLWEYFEKYTNDESFTISSYLLHPKSRGTLELRSRDPYVEPKIDPKYFSNPEDINVLIDSLKLIQKITESPPFRSLNAKIFRKPLECDRFLQKSNEFLECMSRLITLTGYSPVGTCRMGSPTNSTSVVDPELRVIGIKNLRVADASVMPTLVSGNLYASTLMIAQRMANILIERDVNFENQVWEHTHQLIFSTFSLGLNLFNKITNSGLDDINLDNMDFDLFNMNSFAGFGNF